MSTFIEKLIEDAVIFGLNFLASGLMVILMGIVTLGLAYLIVVGFRKKDKHIDIDVRDE